MEVPTCLQLATRPAISSLVSSLREGQFEVLALRCTAWAGRRTLGPPCPRSRGVQNRLLGADLFEVPAAVPKLGALAVTPAPVRRLSTACVHEAAGRWRRAGTRRPSLGEEIRVDQEVRRPVGIREHTHRGVFDDGVRDFCGACIRIGL